MAARSVGLQVLLNLMWAVDAAFRARPVWWVTVTCGAVVMLMLLNRVLRPRRYPTYELVLTLLGLAGGLGYLVQRAGWSWVVQSVLILLAPCAVALAWWRDRRVRS